jgi:hypothetical protein
VLTEHRDLCCICVNGVECIERGTAKRPKFHCEAFDIGVQSSRLREESSPSIVAAVGGLCGNCAHRPCCAIQAPEGEILHCEEYC